ncbi:hypothetical protein [Kibdelosporangium philippinense]|uniref:hypothetical protein n=1 Tax=Kibdelosporangium philippinense TaxID=211113 RepID=UPI0036202F7A
MTASSRCTQWRSAAWTRTGTLPNLWLQETCEPNMCGWLAAITATPPSSSILSAMAGSRWFGASQRRFPR